jgi:hypothetical protein
MILVRRVPHTPQLRASAVLAFQTVLIQISALGLSLFWGEDWGRWRAIGAQDWAVFVAYSLFVVGDCQRPADCRHPPPGRADGEQS